MASKAEELALQKKVEDTVRDILDVTRLDKGLKRGIEFGIWSMTVMV